MSSTAVSRTATLRGRADAIADSAGNWIVGAMRIVAGLLWLANLEWKRPPHFGKDLGNGLYKYIDSGIKNPVFAPYSWFLEHVVLKQYSLFGWITLFTESALAVLLLLGLFTRLASLIAAGMSVSIMLSVLYYPHEWPWSYFLMIAVHLLLFATNAGQHLGLDGVFRRGRTAIATRNLGIVAVLCGIGGLYVARNGGFADHHGALLGWARWELKFVWFNTLGALLTIVLGIVAIASSRMRQKMLGWVAGAGFALMALQVVAQWRSEKGATTGGFLGGTGGTFAFWAMLAVGILVCTARQREAGAPAGNRGFGH